ncbi:MAG: 6-hydroxymethylpterin diphosphokinase MptE-like protein [Promethearchaeota archaeon]|jgi:hypothetical protein
MRNLAEFNGQFSGRTCFIVGAGPSLYGIDLEPVRDHVVIAVNSGYVATPWADFFVSDDWSVAHWSYFFRDLRQSRTTALLYEDKLAKSAGWFGDRSVLFRHQKGICIPDVYEHDDPKKHIGETRTSVGTAIMIAHIMGCSPICLLGIDCMRKSGLRYFWQISPYLHNIPYRNDGVPIDRYKKCKIGGQINDYDLIDIKKTWSAFGEAINKKSTVYNCSKESVLGVFPKMELGDLVG